jgi:hypothetical protein
VDQIERKRERNFWPQRQPCLLEAKGGVSEGRSTSGAWFVRNFFDFVETSQDPDVRGITSTVTALIST